MLIIEKIRKRRRGKGGREGRREGGGEEKNMSPNKTDKFVPSVKCS